MQVGIVEKSYASLLIISYKEALIAWILIPPIFTAVHSRGTPGAST